MQHMYIIPSHKTCFTRKNNTLQKGKNERKKGKPSSSEPSQKFVDLLFSNISMNVLHTVLHTFPKVLTRRICLTVKSFISW